MHGPSSAGEQRGCRGLCPGLAYMRIRCCCPWSRSCLVSRTRTLYRRAARYVPSAYPTTAHDTRVIAAAWLRVIGGGPAFQGDPGLLLEITRDYMLLTPRSYVRGTSDGRLSLLYLQPNNAARSGRRCHRIVAHDAPGDAQQPRARADLLRLRRYPPGDAPGAAIPPFVPGPFVTSQGKGSGL